MHIQWRNAHAKVVLLVASIAHNLQPIVPTVRNRFYPNVPITYATSKIILCTLAYFPFKPMAKMQYPKLSPSGSTKMTIHGYALYLSNPDNPNDLLHSILTIFTMEDLCFISELLVLSLIVVSIV